jgi:hypothetical protein
MLLRLPTAAKAVHRTPLEEVVLARRNFNEGGPSRALAKLHRTCLPAKAGFILDLMTMFQVKRVILIAKHGCEEDP